MSGAAADEQADGNEEFLPSIELMQLGEALIANRECFSELRRSKIAYLWKLEGGKRGGKATFGKCIKASGLAKLYSGVDFVIWLAADHCRSLHFTWWQVEALLFHELKHAGVDDDVDADEKKVFTIPHDWEGFVDEIKFYGLWMPDMEPVHEAFIQLRLFTNESAPDETKVTLSVKGPEGEETVVETTDAGLHQLAEKLSGNRKARGVQ